MNKLLRNIALPAAALMFALAGCGSSPATDGAASTVNTAAATAALAPTAGAAVNDHDRHGHKMPLFGGIDQLTDLTPEQGTKIKAIEDGLHANHAAMRDAHQKLDELLAKGLEAGQLDQTAVDAQVAELARLETSQHAAMADGLDQLHAVLTPAQRTTLVASEQARFAKFDGREGREHDHKGDDAKEAHDGEGLRGPMKMFRDLDLTAGQKDALVAKLPAPPADVAQPDAKRADHVAKMKSFTSAFASDSFDAKSFDFGKEAPKMERGGPDRMVHVVAAAIDVLDAGQRTKLATELRDHSEHGERHGK